MTLMLPLPFGWKQTRLRFLAAINPSKSEVSHLDPSSEVSFVPMEAVGEDASLDASRLKPISEVSNGYTYFRDGDILIAKITPCFENGKATLARNLAGGVGFGSTEFHVVRPSSRFDARFAFYVIRSNAFRDYGAASMYGAGGQKRVPTDFIADFPVALPPMCGQRAIADFLDRETAKIDELIAKQEGLIKAATQKQTAEADVVLTGGTRGGELLPSPVPWLGDAPAHWKFIRARFLFRERSDPPRNDDGVVTAFRDGQVTLRSNRRSDGFTFAELEVGYQHVCKGDLVIHTMDAFAGAIGVSESDGKCTGEYAVCIPRDDRSDNEYYALLLRLMARRGYIYVLCPSVRERAPRFRFVRFADTLLPVPPRPEQAQIVAHIHRIQDTYRALIARCEMQVRLLREHRSALITAAVTGQIEVAANIAEVAA